MKKRVLIVAVISFIFVSAMISGLSAFYAVTYYNTYINAKEQYISLLEEKSNLEQENKKLNNKCNSLENEDSELKNSNSVTVKGNNSSSANVRQSGGFRNNYSSNTCAYPNCDNTVFGNKPYCYTHGCRELNCLNRKDDALSDYCINHRCQHSNCHNGKAYNSNYYCLLHEN